jgi:uncharacterized protein YdhG (YjbR/CyaY superfamily)
MKKTKPRTRADKRSYKGPAKDMDEYLERIPEPGQSTLREVRKVIRSVVPAEATEAIGYGIPTFRYKGALVAFAAFSKHCSFFPMSLAVMDRFKKELKPYRASKGTIHFPLDKPLPSSLVKKIVKARLAEKERKKTR